MIKANFTCGQNISKTLKEKAILSMHLKLRMQTESAVNAVCKWTLKAGVGPNIKVKQEKKI